MPRLRRRALRRRATFSDPLRELLGDSTGSERVIRFIEGALYHSTGQWAGKPFLLEQWQRERIIEPLFGTLRDDGRRRYRHGYLSLPRKAGKTSVCAAISNYLTFADREPGAQVYLAAATREQAGLCFQEAANQVEASPILAPRAVISRAKKTICDRVSRSYLKVISSDAYSAHGLNAHAFVVDEIAQQPNRELVDVLATSMGARRQPLGLYVGTAGWDRQSIAYELYDLAKRIDKGTAIDPTFWHFILEAEEGEDAFHEAVWHRVNPSLGTFRSLDELREMAERAKQTPTFANTFENLYLNRWTSQETKWIPLDRWKDCGGSVDAEALRGRVCYAGLDLGSVSDLSALTLAFPNENSDHIDVLSYFWCPEVGIRQRSKRDRVPYEQWARNGWLTPTPGNVTDYAFIRSTINDLREQHDIRELGYDPFGAVQLITELTADGLECFPVRQGFLTLGPPTRELERLIVAGLLRHGDNPMLTWMAGNVTVIRDAAGNIKIDKARSREKIDGLASLINAIERLNRNTRRVVDYSISWI